MYQLERLLPVPLRWLPIAPALTPGTTIEFFPVTAGHPASVVRPLCLEDRPRPQIDRGHRRISPYQVLLLGQADTLSYAGSRRYTRCRTGGRHVTAAQPLAAFARAAGLGSHVPTERRWRCTILERRSGSTRTIGRRARPGSQLRRMEQPRPFSPTGPIIPSGSRDVAEHAGLERPSW